LSGVDVGGLTPRERSSFHLARFEICLNRKEYDKAREVSERIDVKHLFSSQAKWLEEARQQLAARPRTR